MEEQAIPDDLRCQANIALHGQKVLGKIETFVMSLSRINPTGNTTFEENEAVILSLNTGANHTLGTANVATGTNNDDGADLFAEDLESLLEELP